MQIAVTVKGPRACTTCAKAKARCIPGPGDGSQCERCHRLKKSCSSRPPAPPRIKKRINRSRVAELEKRLDELSSHLAPENANASIDVGASKRSESPPPPIQLQLEALTHPLVYDKQEAAYLSDFNHIFPPPLPGSSKRDADGAQWDHKIHQPSDSLWPQPQEAEAMLQYFLEDMAPLSPFVVLPEKTRAAELRASRPYLWRAIMMVCCFWDGPRQVILGHELLEEIGRAAICGGEPSFDLLQSLLLLMAWFHYALKSAQLTNLLFLARSMCVSLGVKGGKLTEGDSKPALKGINQLDYLRAFAGTYYLNTLVFTTNKRTDVFMNASHLETCCKVLETTKQYPSDEFLVKLVKIQQLAQSISSTMSFDASQPTTRLPLTMVVQSFQEQIEAFRASIPPHLKDSETLNTHMCIAEVLVLDFAISDQHCNSTVMTLTERLRLLWSCVRSLKGFLAIRYAGHLLEKPRFICLSSSDLTYVLITSMKLLTLRLPGWNLEHIGAELRLGQVVENQAQELELTIAKRQLRLPAAMRRAKCIDEPFEGTLKLLRAVREVIRSDLEVAGSGSQGSDNLSVQEPPAVADEAFWQDMLDESVWDWQINPEAATSHVPLWPSTSESCSSGQNENLDISPG